MVSKVQSSAVPTFLVECGSFNPPTIMHLRMFEIARDFLSSIKARPHRVLGGIISPTHDTYQRPGLASSSHRNAMIQLALQSYPFVQLSTWETSQGRWSKTRVTLDTLKAQLTSFLAGSGERPEWLTPGLTPTSTTFQGVRFYLLCGEEVFESLSDRGRWSQDDMTAIVRDHGLVVLSNGASQGQSLDLIDESDILTAYRDNIHFVHSDMGSDISSAKIRLAVRRNRSIKFIVDDKVVDYIREHCLYTQFESNGNSLTCLHHIDDSDVTHLSLSPPYYLPRHLNSIQCSPSKSTQCNDDARRRQKKVALCQHVIARSESMDSLTIPMIDDEDVINDMRLPHKSMESLDQKENRKPRSTKTSKKVGKGFKKTKSETALQVEFNSKGIKITSEKESYL